MPADRVLLFTDVEGSTQLTEQLGDIAASSLWTEHDRIARELMRKWQGHEIDKSDGFLILFDRVESAARFALDLHHAFANLTPPLRARAGIHSGPMIARQNTSEDVTLGAKPLELDGVGKAIASRIMSIARGGQTLLSAPARAALSGGDWKLHSHGHWRMKGLAEPIEVFELGDGRTLFVPPIYSEKAFRVVQSRGGWTALADLPHSLPAERDIFVARDEVLDSLAALFRDERRLVTVLGIGGIGKTRLAIRYASTWLGDYPGGAWFCDLSAASSIDGIALGVAHNGLPILPSDERECSQRHHDRCRDEKEMPPQAPREERAHARKRACYCGLPHVLMPPHRPWWLNFPPNLITTLSLSTTAS